MTIKELRIQLNAFPDSKEVYISSDPEGNNISVIDEVGITMLGEKYDKETIVIYPKNIFVE